MKKVVTVALESSGRMWLDAILAQHPEIELVAKDSVPTGWYDMRKYPDIPRGADVLIVAVRDVHCQRASVRTRNYNDQQGDKFSPAENESWIKNLIEEYGDRVVFFDYEAALIYRQLYLSYFFRLMGVSDFSPTVEYVDGNEKYYANKG